MGLFELILIAIGLSMDAFAVSICKGLNMRRMNSSGRDHRPVFRRFPGADAGHRLVSRQTI